MKVQVSITHKDDQIFLQCPYSEGLIEKFRNVGGKFQNRLWVFSDTPVTVKLLDDLFGKSPELVLVKIPFSHERLSNRGNEIRIGGYKIVSRRFRDSDVQFEEGCMLIEGEISSENGSAKHPKVVPSNDAVFGVTVRKDFASRYELEVIKTNAVDKESLHKEKDSLLERVAEIEAILAD